MGSQDTNFGREGIRELRPGALLDGRYRIQAALGRGGMGVVYLATDLETGARRAVKVLHGRRTGAHDLSRFKREFRAASRLRHPHCVRAFDLGCAEGAWYFAMDYAAGG